jgi:hypothetical protein
MIDDDNIDSNHDITKNSDSGSKDNKNNNIRKGAPQPGATIFLFKEITFAYKQMCISFTTLRLPIRNYNL